VGGVYGRNRKLLVVIHLTFAGDSGVELAAVLGTRELTAVCGAERETKRDGGWKGFRPYRAWEIGGARLTWASARLTRFSPGYHMPGFQPYEMVTGRE
jgi:hypothetical protein